MAKLKFQTPTGMKDILPDEQKYFKKIVEVVEKFANFYGFLKIDPPILEHLGLFEKGTGQNTEVVEKQMYILKTKGGEYLALRPEFTPSIARAYFEHGMVDLPHPVKLYTYGPLFRHERPQAGRLRQFHQFNFEIIGSQKPIVDVEIIYLFYNLLKELKIQNITIRINSIGDNQCRPRYKKVLIKYFKNQERRLCPDCKRRLKTNPLRILDCKTEKCQAVAQKAPQILDYLCEECHNHFKKVLEHLDDLNLPYFLDPYLVRGLDYYTKTVFEIISDTEEGKQLGSLAGGGRYDNLLKIIGKKDIPACGAAGGVERIIALVKPIIKIPEQKPRLFVAQLGDKAKIIALRLIETFRKNNIPIRFVLSKDSLRNQLKIADKLGVEYVILIGEEEAVKNEAIIRNMHTGKQTTVKINGIVKKIKQYLKRGR